MCRAIALLGTLVLAAVAPLSSVVAQDKVVFAQASEASFTHLPILVARGLKLFEAQGIEPEFLTVKNSATLLAGLVSGQVQISFTTATAAIKARAKKQDVRIFASVVGQVNSAVVVQGELASKLGITANSSLDERLKALRGLRLAISAGSANEFILRHLIEHAGMQPDRDVTLIPIGADAMVPAFAHKRIDGFIMASPVTDMAMSSHAGFVLVDFMKGQYAPLKGMAFAVLVASDAWLDANQQIAARVARAIWNAQLILKNEPKKAQEAVVSFFNRLEPAVFSAAFEATRSAIESSPRMEASGIENNFAFIQYSEKEKIELPTGDIFTNRFVDMASALK